MSADTGYAVIRLRRIKIGNPNGFQIFKIGKPQNQSIQTSYGICKKLKRSVWVEIDAVFVRWIGCNVEIASCRFERDAINNWFLHSG